LRYRYLAARNDVDLHLVVPAVWTEFGRTFVTDPSRSEDFPVHVLPIRLSRAGPINWYLHYYPALRKLLRELDPDVIHLWEEPWSVVALQAQLLRKRASLVLEVDQNILKKLPPPFEQIRKFVLARTDHILSRSPAADMVVRACGYTGPATPIGYGVDPAIFVPGTKLETGDARFRIGYVGRLIEEKGLDDALEAIAATATPVTLGIMGEGPHEARLRQRIAALGLGTRVEIRGWGSAHEVAKFLHGLDALILLTRTTADVREQFGRVIIEAQACGIPVIGSTGGAIPDIVGEGGWIVPEHDPGQLGRLLDALADDPAEVSAKAIAARANVQLRFTYDVVAAAIETACRAAVRTAPQDLKLRRRAPVL
jgi:glycosyltransferase involved in cell wall biosynthesis